MITLSATMVKQRKQHSQEYPQTKCNSVWFKDPDQICLSFLFFSK
jgi:hypothetical protein